MFEHIRQGAVDVIRGAQPLNIQTVAEFSSLLEPCVRQRQPRIVLEMSGIPLIDSRGMEVLVDLQRQCMSRGGCIKLASLSTLCRDILRATNVIVLFDVFDNSITAAGSFAQ